MIVGPHNLPAVAAKAPRPTSAELAPLLERARKKDKAAAEELARVLVDDPERLIRLGRGDLAPYTEDAWIINSFKKDPFRQLAIKTRVDQLREELSGPTPTPIERLLVDRVVVTWIQMQIYDGIASSDKHFSVGEWQKRSERAQRCYLSAIKALAQVRKLTLPAMQVNVALAGGQQVNVTNP